MEGYLSIRETAQKWGVLQRRIHQYCAQGRIPGAERFGGSWAIPEHAEKPVDPRKGSSTSPSSAPKKKDPQLLSNLMPLMNTPFEPGNCMEILQRMKAGPQKDIALAEYHYFTGQAEKVMEETQCYLIHKDASIRLSACLLYAYACLTMGQIAHTRYALHEIKSTLTGGTEQPPICGP